MWHMSVVGKITLGKLSSSNLWSYIQYRLQGRTQLYSKLYYFMIFTKENGQSKVRGHGETD